MDQNNLEGLPEIIRKLAESPEIADIIKNAGIGEVPAEPQSQKSEGFSLPPDIMEKLPMVMAALQGSGIAPQQSTTQQSTTQQSGTQPQQTTKMPDMNEIAAKLPQVMTALSAMGVSGAGNHSPRSEDRNRKALLNALRPYMSDRKRGAIDTMLGMGSLAEIMKMLMGGES